MSTKTNESNESVPFYDKIWLQALIATGLTVVWLVWIAWEIFLKR